MKNSERGFTLVEMLVALVAGSLVLVTLGYALRELSAELLRTENSATISVEDANVLTALIQDALPDPKGDGAENDASHFTILTRPPDALGPIGLVRANMSVARDRDGVALQIKLTPAESHNAIPAIALEPRLLGKGLTRIHFELTPPPPDATVGAAPKLVTLIFENARGSVQTVSAAPRVTAVASCHFDPISMECRH